MTAYASKRDLQRYGMIMHAAGAISLFFGLTHTMEFDRQHPFQNSIFQSINEITNRTHSAFRDCLVYPQ
jgi:hypothetical protein